MPLRLAVPVSVRFSTVGAERIGDRGQHRVGALAGVLDHHVADIVDHVGVVAEPARHGVGTGAAVEDVVAGVAGEAVGQGIAGAVDGWRCR